MREILGKYVQGMKHADMHIHTVGSDGLLTAQNLVDLAVHHPFRIDVIVVTDHNTTVEAEKAREYALRNDYPIEVVIGEEITTKEGHVLAIDIESPIPRGLSVEDTIRRIHRAGGLVIIPHPFYFSNFGLSIEEQTLLGIVHNPDLEVCADAVEIFNSGVGDNKRSQANQRAQTFFLEHRERLGAATAATDAHFHTIGRGITAYSGGSLREAIQARNTVALALEDHEAQVLRRFVVEFFGEEEVLHPKRKAQASLLERRQRRSTP